MIVNDRLSVISDEHFCDTLSIRVAFHIRRGRSSRSPYQRYCIQIIIY
ncbi:hypothetical protein T08_5609 [Trichinella sp. T8]|nr:hypothetical protein T08_5609 [Trichinella sp. T8]